MTAVRLLAVACATLHIGVLDAANGLNDVGYGSESAALAGADIALARDTAAFNINPAGAAQIMGERVDLLLEPYSFLDSSHSDSVGNDVGPDDPHGVAGGGGYALRLSGTDVVLGVGLFVQGGAGQQYEDFATPFGTRDELSGIFGAVKIAPGLAWRVNDRWNLGAAVGLLYSTARLKVFPETSTPAFSGYRADRLRGISANIKLGAQYRPAQNWVIAAVFTSKAPIRLEDGRVTFNFSGSGGSKVTYSDASVKGLAFAQEVSLGARYRVNERWELVTDITHVDWSRAMLATTLTARNPDDATAAGSVEIPTRQDWRDQVLMAAGVLFAWKPDVELRAGLSHARNPIPESTLSPLLPLISRTTVAAGVASQLDREWLFAASVIYQPRETVHYQSALTGASTETAEVTGAYLTLSRHW